MTTLRLLGLSLFFLIMSCGQADFTGEAGESNQAKQPANSDVVKTDQNSKPSVNVNAIAALASEQEVEDFFDDSSEGKALKTCLRTWGVKSMKKETLEGVKILEGSNGGLLANSEIADLDYTDERALILVKVLTGGLLAKTTLKLMNPMGMYCITTSTSGTLADFSIQKHCKAKIAEDNSSTSGMLANKTMSNTECN